MARGCLCDGFGIVVDKQAQRKLFHEFRVGVVYEDGGHPDAGVDSLELTSLDEPDEHVVEARSPGAGYDVGRETAFAPNELHVPVVALAQETVDAVQLLAPRRACKRQCHHDPECRLCCHVSDCTKNELVDTNEIIV